MSLRRKDDWDEALEEARNNAIARGEINPGIRFVPGRDYDYGCSIVITKSDMLGEDTGKHKLNLTIPLSHNSENP